MSSTESARLVLIAVWVVATLTVSSASMRARAAPPPRARRYAVAWFVCTVVLGGLLLLMDRMIGAGDWRRQLINAAIAAVVSAAGLVAGSLLARLTFWTRLHAFPRFVLLVVIQAAVVFVVGYPLL
ncbi:MAG: hypothetical protein ACRENU_16435 [Gemmatimonadaceae bacterium]